MILFMYPQLQRFLIFYFVEENNFHWACNNFYYKHISFTDDYFDNDNNINNFNIIIKGKITAKYTKNSNYHSIINEEKLSKIKFKDDDFEGIEISLDKGDIFCKYLKYKGYTLSSVKIWEDLDLLYIENKTYLKIFDKSITRIEREMREFILKTMKPFRDLPSPRLNYFLDQSVTNVYY